MSDDTLATLKAAWPDLTFVVAEPCMQHCTWDIEARNSADEGLLGWNTVLTGQGVTLEEAVRDTDIRLTQYYQARDKLVSLMMLGGRLKEDTQ